MAKPEGCACDSRTAKVRSHDRIPPEGWAREKGDLKKKYTVRAE